MILPNQSDNLVTFEGVNFIHYGRTAPTLVDVNLSIRCGSFTLLVGPSGSGKSTLCMLLNGIIPHLLGGELTGRVVVDEHNVAETQVRDLARSVGLLFQDPEWMFATLHVEDEVAFGPENLLRPTQEISQSVTTALEYVGMNSLRKNLVWALSGGQIQRLGLAAVLAMQPKLIVLDEPTANLDPATTHAVHKLILRLRNEGKTVVLVTKDLDEYMAEADDLILLAEGQVVAQGSPRVVVEQYGLEMLELGVWLPEPTEIGLRLKKQSRLSTNSIPLTVSEAAETFSNLQFKPNKNVERQATSTDTLVKAEGMEFSYTSKTKALRNVSFKIHQGEIAAIVGQNGAGKSTLSKLLVGLLKPSGGMLMLFGKPAREWKVQALSNEVALVFQNPEHQFLCDTVAEELAYSLLAKGVDNPDEVKRRVEDMLARLDIAGTADIHPFALSAGAKRRLGVATMLIGGRARLLIVDEPTYGQDRRLTECLMSLINDLRKDGITVVIITHDMRLVDAHIERAIVMAEGEIIFDGSPAVLFQSPEIVEKAALRPAALRRLVDALRGKGVNVPDGVNTVEAFIEALI